MKKKIYIFISILLLLTLFGCDMNPTPKKKVEVLLSDYQKHNEVITSELDDYLKTLTTDDNIYLEYKKVYLRQYEDLTYEIKDETIDGDYATVTAQIDVYDYYKVDLDASNYITNNPIEFSNDGIYDANKGMLYRIDALSKTNERVTYTITINLTKVNNDWTIDNLTNEDLEKIHGTYAH